MRYQLFNALLAVNVIRPVGRHHRGQMVDIKLTDDRPTDFSNQRLASARGAYFY